MMLKFQAFTYTSWFSYLKSFGIDGAIKIPLKPTLILKKPLRQIATGLNDAI